MSDELVVTQDKRTNPGAITKITAYVAERDGAVVVEVDTDANFDGQTDIRVYVNDGPAWEGRV